MRKAPRRISRLALLALGLCAAAGCGRDRDAGPKVVLIGIDGATFTVLQPLLEAGRLPTLAGLIEHGASGVLRSERPLASPVLWTTLATSRPPELHGITGFLYRDGHGARRLVDSSRRARSAFWTWLPALGRSVGVVGWWASWPAEPVDGFVVTDRMARSRWGAAGGAPQPGLTHPPELAKELEPLVFALDEERLGELRLLAQWSDPELARLRSIARPLPFDPLSDLRFGYVAQRSTEEMALRLLEREQPDLTAIFLGANDPISRGFWPFYRPHDFDGRRPAAARRLGTLIPRFQEHLDRYLTRLLDAVAPHSTIVLVSAHGFRASGESRVGERDPDGIFVAQGPGIRPGVRVEATLYDVAPTLLALLGLPVAEDLTGRVLEEILEPGVLEARPVASVPSFEPFFVRGAAPAQPGPGDAALRDRLEALGYRD